MADQTYLDDNGNPIAASAPAASSAPIYLDENTGEPAASNAPARATQIRYSAPGQGVQEYTKGSTDEQQFLRRFPNAKAVSSYERTLMPHETVNTENPDVRSARETSEAKKSLGAAAAVVPAVAAAPIVGAMGAGAGLAGLALESGAAGLGAGAADLGARSMVGGPTTEDVKSAGKTAATTTAMNFGIGAGFRVLPKLASAAKDFFSYNPEDLHAAITDTAQAAAPEAQVGGSVRSSFEKASNTVLAKSKDLYAQVDAATGGAWSANEQALQNVTLKLQNTTGTLPDEQELDLLAKKTRLEWQQSALLDKMVEKGVPQETIDAAKANYKKAMALADVDAAIKSSTVPGAETNASIAEKESADPKKLLGRLTKLLDSGRLQQALGNDQAAIKLFAETKAASIMKDAVDMHKWVATKFGIPAAEIGAGVGLYRYLDPFARFGGKLHSGSSVTFHADPVGSTPSNVVPDISAKPAPMDWVNEPKVQAAMAAAWQKANNGTGPNDSEAGFSITGTMKGYGILPHPNTNQHGAITVPLQSNTAAEIHVHPLKSKPEPSDNDMKIADQHKIPVYTIHQNGVFKYDPATKKTARLGSLEEFVK